MQPFVLCRKFEGSNLAFRELEAISSHLISMLYSALKSRETFSRNSESRALQNEVRCRQIVQPNELDAHLSATIIIRVDKNHRVVIRSASLVELLVVDIALL